MKYPVTDVALYQAVLRYPVRGARVLVVGSFTPTYEALAIALGAARVDVVEYNLPPTRPAVDNLHYVTPAEFEAGDDTYDAVFSISSVEHDGLGR